MRRFLFIKAILAGLIFIIGAGASADQTELIDRMKFGGHILMIRHALAPGSGDPPNFKIGDCSTQRNLDDSGRIQARSIGMWLRTNGIKSARIYSSQWCRCLETANLIDLGPVHELAALNSFYEKTEDREPNLSALNQFISQQPVEGKLIVLVTHFVTIAAIAGTSVSSGEGVLLELQKNMPYMVVGRLNFGQ
ncbi:MAG: histidine phosphatase family protein [Desulfobacterales bacterium]|nr:histidine phosphatase family protein [Desulfobacterales bacterium]